MDVVLEIQPRSSAAWQVLDQLQSLLEQPGLDLAAQALLSLDLQVSVNP